MYVTDSLMYAVENKRLVHRFIDLLEGKTEPEETAEDIVSRVIGRFGLSLYTEEEETE